MRGLHVEGIISVFLSWQIWFSNLWRDKIYSSPFQQKWQQKCPSIAVHNWDTEILDYVWISMVWNFSLNLFLYYLYEQSTVSIWRCFLVTQNFMPPSSEWRMRKTRKKHGGNEINIVKRHNTFVLILALFLGFRWLLNQLRA